MKSGLLKIFQSKSRVAPIASNFNFRDRESISAQFYIENRKVLEPLNHLAVAPKITDYGDIQEYKKAFDITMQAITELKQFCSQSEAGMIWFEDYYCHCLIPINKILI